MWSKLFDLLQTRKQFWTHSIKLFDFLFCYRDTLSYSAVKRLSGSRQLYFLNNLTDLLRRTFSSQFVFPALGHDDPLYRKDLGNMWSRWLPTDSMTTFESGNATNKLYAFLKFINDILSRFYVKRYHDNRHFYNVKVQSVGIWKSLKNKLVIKNIETLTSPRCRVKTQLFTKLISLN